MPVKMKKEIRKRVACMIGTTQEAIRKAEAECDGRLYMGPIDATGTLGGFYPRQGQDCANALSD